MNDVDKYSSEPAVNGSTSVIDVDSSKQGWIKKQQSSRPMTVLFRFRWPDALLGL
jgi:hypothetical protein